MNKVVKTIAEALAEHFTDSASDYERYTEISEKIYRLVQPEFCKN